MIGIVAYMAEQKKDKVIIHRAIDDKEDTLVTEDWQELVEFLTEGRDLALSICWNLVQFRDCLFSLLPPNKREELKTSNKIQTGNTGIYTMIYSISYLLGITTCRAKPNNYYDILKRNNFYGIAGAPYWLPSSTKEPSTVAELEKLGYSIIVGLEKMEIYPNKLTSPIGVFVDTLDISKLPTIHSFDKTAIDAQLWADKILAYEWRESFGSTSKDEYHYDLTSAYGSFAVDLPNTDHAEIIHSEKWINCDWGIVKSELVASSKVSPLDPDAEYFTTEEILWGVNHDHKFELADGWYFNFNGDNPYKAILERLLDIKQNNDGLVEYLAKRMQQGIAGKLGQVNDNGTWGELFNPILSLMIRSRCRLAVADFIYSNNLENNLIEVKVDGVTATKKLDLPTISEAGEWRMEV